MNSFEETSDMTSTSINDLVPDHLVSCGSRLLFVNPIRLVPMVVRNQPKVNRSIRQDPDPATSPRHRSPSSANRKKKQRKSRENTHDLNSSVNSSSFKNTYGYPYLLLNLSSICFILKTIPSISPFLANDTILAFAFRSGGAGLASFTVS